MISNLHGLPKLTTKADLCGDCGNYRPISVVSHLAKVLEKLSKSQLITYINENSFVMEGIDTALITDVASLI